jgi:hypothetical protein
MYVCSFNISSCYVSLIFTWSKVIFRDQLQGRSKSLMVVLVLYVEITVV